MSTTTISTTITIFITITTTFTTFTITTSTITTFTYTSTTSITITTTPTTNTTTTETTTTDTTTFTISTLCSDECFTILDHASASFQLKIKEVINIQREKPTFNNQLYHVNLKLSL